MRADHDAIETKIAISDIDQTSAGRPSMRNLLYLLGLLSATLIGASARAGDQALVDLHASLAPLRPGAGSDDGKRPTPFHYAGKDTELRDATPALMVVKHLLRDWIESRLAAMGEHGDEKSTALRVNDELRRADLFREGASKDSPDRCAADIGDWNGIGFLEPVRFDRQQLGRVLVVRTSVGILCGSDQSAYAYEWRDKRWQRFWQGEQDIQPGKPYAPQYVDAVDISWPDEKTHNRLVLSLGNQGWCSSNFYNVYFRLWRTNPDGGEPKLILDEAQLAYLGQHDPPIIGSIGRSDALIEFRITSLDTAVHSYETVRHYRIDGDKVVRIDPIALSPRDFTEEWLRADWAESAQWEIPHPPASLEPWHKRFHTDYISGEYIDDTQHCRQDPDLWQVGIGFGEVDEPKDNAYFFIRWRPPYHFEMVNIGATPRPDCNEPDEAADREHTLFPIQDWRD